MAQQNSENIIESMMEEHRQVMEQLQKTGDISLQSRIDLAFSKTLLLSAASYFESRITNDVLRIFQDGTNGSDALISFVPNKAVARRYHEWFDWTASNANRFFRAFGEEFSGFMQQRIKDDPSLGASIRAFLELGNLRNQLVHENYALFPLGKTVPEVYEMYEKAVSFVEGFPEAFSQFIQQAKE